MNTCRVRWGFDFADKNTVRGLWSSPGGKFNTAYSVDKRSMTRAFIEVEHRATGKVSRVVDLPKNEFVNFQWGARFATYLGRTQIVSLKLVGSKKTFEVDSSGKLTVSETDANLLKLSFRGTGS